MIPPRQPYRIAQICVVVEDLEKALKTYQELMGWGPWQIYDYKPPVVHSRRLHGKEEDFTMIGAEFEVQPGLSFELIQPLEGPSIYKEHLEKHGEGLHHLAVVMPTLAEADVPRDHFARNGIGVSMEGKLGEEGGPGEYCYFYYMETEPQLKFVLESFVLESGSDAEQPADAVRQAPPAT